MSPARQPITWNLVPSVMLFGSGSFGRWLGHENRALLYSIGALIKETPERSLTSAATWGHSKKDICEPGGRLSLDADFASNLILNFVASKTVKNQF